MAIDNNDYYECPWGVDFAEINYNVKYKELAPQLCKQSDEILSENQCKFLDSVYERFEYDFLEMIDRILYFLIILKVVHEAFEPTWKWGISDLRLPFYIVYRPPLIVSRIENQSSIFIQQQYLEFSLDSS